LQQQGQAYHKVTELREHNFI